MTETMMDQVTRMKELYQAFGRGDVPTALAGMDDNIEWYEAGGNPGTWGVRCRTAGCRRRVFQRIGADFDGFEILPTRFLGAGDTVIMEGRYRAQSAKATGKPLDAEVVHVWDLRDRKVVRFHQYVDTRQLANVLAASD